MCANALTVVRLVGLCLVAQVAAGQHSAPSSVQRVERRVPDNVLKETTTAEPFGDPVDDVFAIPIDDFRGEGYELDLAFGPLTTKNICWLNGKPDSIGIVVFTKFRCRDYWYGRRLKKRSLLSYDEDYMDKRGQYQPWGGKRARWPQIFQVPTRFNPNGGKRSPRFRSKDAEYGKKRTPKTFEMWAGKRSNPPNGKSFVIWGGKKRADQFTTWGGKRADSFRTWGGKRSEPVDN